MAKPLRNVGASVRARLLTISKTRDQTFDLVLTRARNPPDYRAAFVRMNRRN